MATVNAGAAGSLNMLDLQLAALQYGNVPIYDASTIRIDNGFGRFVDFGGAFAYPPGMGDGYDPYGYGGGVSGPTSYYPSSGTITQITEMTPAGPSLVAAGLTVDAPTLFSMAQARDADGILNAVFAGSDVFTGTGGDDWIDGYGGDDNMAGGGGNDSARGLDGADSLDGGPGGDDVNGNRGEDLVLGGDGVDIVRGGQGDDNVFGGAGDDVHVNGNIGQDIVHGDGGDDQVFGGQGLDQLFGDDGADTLSGDLGDDTLTGGGGGDRFLFRAGSGRDVVADFDLAAGDRVQLAAGQAFALATVGGQAVVDIGGGETLTLIGVAQASLNDWLVIG